MWYFRWNRFSESTIMIAFLGLIIGIIFSVILYCHDCTVMWPLPGFIFPFIGCLYSIFMPSTLREVAWSVFPIFTVWLIMACFGFAAWDTGALPYMLSISLGILGITLIIDAIAVKVVGQLVVGIASLVISIAILWG